MKYISTRGQTNPINFKQAVLMGLATDGGLLLPDKIPSAGSRLAEWRNLPYKDLAAAVMSDFIGDDISKPVLNQLIEKSYAKFESPDIVPVLDLQPLHFAELFHGPTLAFKDVALQFLGNLFELILEESGERLNILGATSGDTGSAAIHGIRGKANMDIFIMHPDGKVSPIQRQQMTSVLDSNVHNIAVKGNFDDSQRVLKDIFNDLQFKEEYNLGAVNSVNWARLLAQIVYYFFIAFRVQERTAAEVVQICVPTGNFGNVFAGYIAARMGAPIKRLIVATNENDILARFFKTGVYERGPVSPTSSPSMDIQVASNFERYLYYRLDGDTAGVRQLMADFAKDGKIELKQKDPLFISESGDVKQVVETIKDFYKRHDYILDPHSAVGVSVAHRNRLKGIPTVCLGTAHPAKFPGAVRQALGKDLARHPKIEAIMDLPARCTTLPAHCNAVKDFIRITLSG